MLVTPALDRSAKLYELVGKQPRRRFTMLPVMSQVLLKLTRWKVALERRFLTAQTELRNDQWHPGGGGEMG